MAFDNDVPDSTALKRDDSNPMSTEELSYLHNFTFTYFMNCLVAFDSKEKGKSTQLASTNLEKLLSQQIKAANCKLFFEYYFTKDNDSTDMKNGFREFIEKVTTLVRNFETNNIKCGIEPSIELTKLTLAVLGFLYTNISDHDKLRFITSLLVKNGNVRKRNTMCDTLFLTWIYLSSAVLPNYKSLYEEKGNVKEYENNMSRCKNRIVQNSFGDSEELSLQDFLRKVSGMETNFTCVYFRKELARFETV